MSKYPFKFVVDQDYTMAKLFEEIWKMTSKNQDFVNKNNEFGCKITLSLQKNPNALEEAIKYLLEKDIKHHKIQMIMEDFKPFEAKIYIPKGKEADAVYLTMISEFKSVKRL